MSDPSNVGSKPTGGETQAAEPRSADVADQADGSGDGSEVDGSSAEAVHRQRVEQAERDGHKLYVVGIGASAGGLEALGELVKHVPLDSMAFVVVQHLAPQYDSLLTNLLARTSKVAVVTAADGMAVEPNHVYVIPPNADLAVMHGVLHLISPVGGYGPRLPIDFFFRSLADDKGSCAIGIVLSGTGSDGTFGIQAIKAAGGITLVQEPSSARYEGMPRSALESGNADFCLTLEGIGEELTRIGRQPPRLSAPRAMAATPEAQEQLAKLFVLVRSELGNDLSQYKPGTVERRIERRMVLHKLTRFADYVKYVRSNAEELRALHADMLITVTSFFRDPETFEALRTNILPRLFEQKAAHAPIRVWVPGCATGEEAYSIAICILELLEDHASGARVQIFATDVDDDSIQQARRGIYAQNIAPDVSLERLGRFFSRKGNDYVVSRTLRDMIVFSQQNLFKDAPFSRIDLVSCRNLLIYLKPAAQKKVLRALHYALNPGGFLQLGTSESVTDAPDLFAVVDAKNKIYSRQQVASVAALALAFDPHGAGGPVHPAPAAKPLLSLRALADRKTLELYGPPGVLISESMEILHFRGRTGPYLDPAPGAASLNLLRLARPALSLDLRRAIQQALSSRSRVTLDSSFREDTGADSVRLDVVPIQETESNARCLLVLFHKLPPPREVPVLSPGLGEPGKAISPLTARIRELEQELALTKEYLQSTIEDKEKANEELKSANEELQSSNEELQSTNEELETSKEEMQSSNEELTTVNEELQNRMGELDLANDDLHNVLAAVGDAVVIVGIDLRIRRYTTAAEKLFNLVPGDLGRAIGFLDSFLGAGAIAKRITAVIESLTVLDEEVLAANQRWYSLVIAPYKTLDHSICGAVVRFTDIDLRKRTAELTRDVGAYADQLLGAIAHPLLIVDAKLRIVWANGGFYQLLQVTPDDAVGQLFAGAGARQWGDPQLQRLLEATVAGGEPFRDFALRLPVPGAGEQALRIGGGRVPMAGDAVLVLVSIEGEPGLLTGQGDS
jgi:two-component system CheB/CheR fusion protein